MDSRLVRFLVVLILPVAVAVARAEDWPQFRGPTGQGISRETGLPAEFGPQKNVVWKVTVPGKGWSSPIVYRDRIYLTTAVKPPKATGNQRSLRALCLDANSGKTIWDVEVFQQTDPATHIHNKNSHASPTPLTDGRFLYVHFGPQGTACLTLDGKPVWKTRQLKYDPRHGSGNSPVLADDVLFVNCDGYDKQFIVALDRKTGKVRWKKDRPPVDNPKGFSFSTPLVIEVHGKPQIVSPATDQVVAYDPQTGREIWKCRYDGYSVIPRPVYAHGLLFLSTSYNQAKLLAISPEGTGDVTRTHLKWSISRGAPHTPSALVVGREVYFVSDRGIASCADAESGKLHWQHRLGGNFSASPVYADGRIYLQSEQGVTTVIKPGTRYKRLAVNRLGERTLASPAVAEGAIFLRTETKLYRFEKM